jgi:membrane protein YqaA with SNARE-associated domain
MAPYLTVLLVFTLSGLFPIISAEGFAAAAGLTGDPRFSCVPLSITLASSQLVSFSLLYFVGDGVVRWFPKIEGRLDALRPRLEKATWPTIVISSIIGIPPLLAIGPLAGSLRVGLLRYLGVVFLARVGRFAVLYHFGDQIMMLFGDRAPSSLPF